MTYLITLGARARDVISDRFELLVYTQRRSVVVYRSVLSRTETNMADEPIAADANVRGAAAKVIEGEGSVRDDAGATGVVFGPLMGTAVGSAVGTVMGGAVGGLVGGVVGFLFGRGQVEGIDHRED